MHRGRLMGESFDHRPAGWIRQSRKRGVQFIHNRMVVDYPEMSSADFGVPDFSFVITEPSHLPVFCRINEPQKGAHFLNGPQHVSDYQCLEEKARRSEDQKKRIVRRILKASA